MRSLLLILLVLALLAAAVPALTETAAPQAPEPTQAAEPVETAAPEAANFFAGLQLTTLDGAPFDASVLDGKPIFLNIWATWCPPCVGEMPHLNELAPEYADRIAIIGLHSEGLTVTAEAGFIPNEDANAKARELAAQAGYTYPLLNPDQSLFIVMNSDDYGLRVEVLPTTWLIDGDGYVRRVLEGAYDKEGWVEIIDEFLTMLEGEADAA